MLISWFNKALMEAYDNQSSEANISMLFNNDLLAEDMETFRTEDVYKHLLNSGTFKVIEDTETVLKLAFVLFM